MGSPGAYGYIVRKGSRRPSLFERSIRRPFARRFLFGTSRWNAILLLLFLLVYAVLSWSLFVMRVGAPATAYVLTGFVAMLMLGSILYYGARHASLTRQFDAEKVRADSEARIVTELQKAFAQQQLPTVSNLGFSASYIPASVGALVGGDWYDVFELPQGYILFTIGDVMGHGVEAAVAMTRTRQKLIAAALTDSDPGAILARVNISMVSENARVATAICGIIDPATLQVTYATAGHPPAILIESNGSPRLLEYDGLPLGVESSAAYPTFRVQAKHDSLLIVYTDGVIEYDRDLIAGERRMLETASDIAARRVENSASAIQDAIFAQYQPLDDVAILTIAFRDRAQHDAAKEFDDWSVSVSGVRAPYTDPHQAT